MVTYLKSHHARRRLRAAISSCVALSLALAPLSAAASQSSSQSSASGTNKLATMLSTAVGVLSVAQGALSIKKGMEQYSCCSSGCDTGSGKKAVADQAANKASSEASGEAVRKSVESTSGFGEGKNNTGLPINPGRTDGAQRTSPEFNHRFPDSVNATEIFRFHIRALDLFLGARVATATGCTDAMLSIATGGVMLLSGMLGLMSAMQTSKNADTAADNASNLGAYGAYPNGVVDPNSLSGMSGDMGGSGTSGASGSGLAGADGTNGNGANGSGTNGTGTDGTNGSSSTQLGANNDIGSTKAPTSSITLDPSLLKNGTAGQVMSQFEKQFGIDRNQFAADLAAGKDPRDILASAPQNPISKGDFAKAEGAANGMSDAQKNAALAGGDLAAIQKELLANAGFGSDAAMAEGSRKTASSGASTSTASALTEADLTPTGLNEGDGPGVSPEIKAALAERQASGEVKSHVDTSLFEVVHRKYMDKARMITGAGIMGGRSASN